MGDKQRSNITKLCAVFHPKSLVDSNAFIIVWDTSSEVLKFLGQDIT